MVIFYYPFTTISTGGQEGRGGSKIKYTYPWTPISPINQKNIADFGKTQYYSMREQMIWDEILGRRPNLPKVGSTESLKALQEADRLYGANKLIPQVVKAAASIAFVIELSTYTLYFFEEAMVIFMRRYKEYLFRQHASDIGWLSIVDFDYIMYDFISYWYQWGLLAVYSCNAFGNYLYAMMM